MDITNVLKTDQGWEYYFDSTTAKDIFLNGVKLKWRYTESSFELITTSKSIPEIEIVTVNRRGYNSWSSQWLTIQWFRDDEYNAYAVEEYSNGILSNRDFIRTEGPERYYNASYRLRRTSNVSQTWMVKPARRNTDGSYRILGGPIPVEMNRHFLPNEPKLRFRYVYDDEELTDEIEIYE